MRPDALRRCTFVWQFSLTEYDVVLFSDLDMDLLPWQVRLPGNSGSADEKQRWWSLSDSVSAFLKSRALLVASPDRGSPINLGFFLARPRRWVYQGGLKLLREATWDESQGFNAVGTPRGLMAGGGDAQQQLVAQLAAGSNLSAVDVSLSLNRTKMMRTNSWHYIGGNTDQGMFFYYFYLLHSVGTWPSLSRPRHPYYAEHYWGSPKPWELSGRGYFERGMAYLGRLRGLRRGRARSTRCGVYLNNLLHKLREVKRTRASQLRRVQGAGAIRQPLLPSPRVAAHWPLARDARHFEKRT